MRELISIIMPVYNGEKYLRKSLACINNQTYENIEIIAVNDGSADNSLELLKKIRKRIKRRLIIINQDNQGISAARNAGIEKANGKYIMFMDQDDLMKKDAVSDLCYAMQKENADIAIGGVIIADEKGKISEKWHLNPDCMWSRYKINAPWGRIYKKELLDKYSIRFKEHKIGEDFYFNHVYLSYCNKVSVLKNAYYVWVIRPQSESHANYIKISDERDIITVLNDIKNNSNYIAYKDNKYADFQFLKYIVWYLLLTAKESRIDDIKNNYCRCKKWIDSNIPKALNHSILNPLFPKGESVKIKMIVFLSSILIKTGLFKRMLILYSIVLKTIG